jgi:L-iduronidase
MQRYSEHPVGALPPTSVSATSVGEFLPTVLNSSQAPSQPPEGINVDFGNKIGPLTVFWNGSGQDYHPTGLSQTNIINMQMIGSIPHQGNHYQRDHNLLSLPVIKSLSGSTLNIDWSSFDQRLDAIVGSGQQLFFELMGYPAGSSLPGGPCFNDTAPCLFTAFDAASNVQFWRNYIAAVASHCEARYGVANVRSWYFEMWNEPDLNGWTTAELLNYFDASRAGLNDVDLSLLFGGPSVSDPTTTAGSGLLNVLITHALSGASYLSGASTRIDFVSWHYKALPAAQARTDANIISTLRSKYPSIRNIMFINSEADSELGWTTNNEFRATPWYSSYLARQIILHQTQVVEGLGANFRLSNDNAFIGDWGQRTQFKWYGDKNSFALIKKPQHNILTLLSLLGDQQVVTTGDTSVVSSLASVRGTNQAAVIVTHYSDITTDTSNQTVTLKLNNLPFSSGKIVEYRIDPNNSNIYKLWQSLGSPATLSQSQLQTLRDGQEIARLSTADFSSPGISVTLDLPAQGVSLLLLSADPGTAPAEVTDVKVYRCASVIRGRDDLMVSWQSDSRFVRTFEVYHSASASGAFVRVNTPDILSTGYTYQVPAGSTGYFKVRAVDFWGRAGAFSSMVGI